MKVIIAGGRDFNLPEYLTEVMSFLGLPITEVVSGGQKTKTPAGYHGADFLGEQWAKSNNLPVRIFPANWTKFGNSAGPKRNAEMAKYADLLVAFWDSNSRGTSSMIDKMKSNKKPFIVFFY